MMIRKKVSLNDSQVSQLHESAVDLEKFLNSVLSRLPKEQRDLLSAYFLFPISYAELAKIRREPIAITRRLLYQAKKDFLKIVGLEFREARIVGFKKNQK